METNFVEKKKDNWVNLNKLYLDYTNNPNAKDLNNLIIAFQPFITALANDFSESLSYCNCDFEDLQQEANLYLFKIIQAHSYQQNSKASFTSYCYTSLSNKLKRLLNKASTPFNIDTYALNKIKAIRDYYKTGDKEKVNEKDIKKYQPFNGCISLNTPINKNDDSNETVELVDILNIEDNQIENLYTKLDAESLIIKIKNMIPNKDFNILFDKYINELSLDELVNKYNMSKKEIQLNLTNTIKNIQRKLKI